jgi:hypothetical protein
MTSGLNVMKAAITPSWVSSRAKTVAKGMAAPLARSLAQEAHSSNSADVMVLIRYGFRGNSAPWLFLFGSMKGSVFVILKWLS